MLQCVRRAWRLAPDHPEVHACAVRFAQAWQRWTSTQTLAPAVNTVISTQMEPILRGRTPLNINTQFLNANGDSLPAIFQAAKMMYHLDPSTQQTAIKLVTNLSPTIKDVTLQMCSKILKSFNAGDFGDCDEATEAFATECRKRYPHATEFQPATSDCKAAPPQPDASQHVLESQENCVSN
ncbi:hypothetical protein LSTR_LSTR005698 [Laodelphax striatellus]|uniref:Uncharacterized protein n=1 Tax=Laodelphax striatellus TaxID=195883 RepID=A0A482X8X0_LAOST|nr:hypothetical protein LSTR_LSTR005698 [Laodelphax striatellus]